MPRQCRPTCKNRGYVHKSLALAGACLHSSSVVRACHVVLFGRSTSKGGENQSALLKRAGMAASCCFSIFVPHTPLTPLICLMSTCQSGSLHPKPVLDPTVPLPPPAVPSLRPPLSPIWCQPVARWPHTGPRLQG